MKRKLCPIVIAIVTVTGLSAAAMFARRGDDAPAVATDVVSRGDDPHRRYAPTARSRRSTRFRSAPRCRASIQSLGADFNSIVKKGQVLARLDPSLIQAEIERAKANLLGAEADVERLHGAAHGRRDQAEPGPGARRAPADPDERSRGRARSRGARAEAQVKAASAQVTQARAALSQSQVNLQKTVIARRSTAS